MRRARVALSVTCRLEATSLTTGERSDTETVTLRSERGDWKRAIARWYLASRLLNLVYLLLKMRSEQCFSIGLVCNFLKVYSSNFNFLYVYESNQTKSSTFSWRVLSVKRTSYCNFMCPADCKEMGIITIPPELK